jgi:hypothetical protein
MVNLPVLYLPESIEKEQQQAGYNNGERFGIMAVGMYAWKFKQTPLCCP